MGVAGLMQGGGFGKLLKGFWQRRRLKPLLEADRHRRRQGPAWSSPRSPSHFWALKGGGGGSFGVVTRLTLATHELPPTPGKVGLTVHAHSADAFRRLPARFIDLYAANLCNPRWGETVTAGLGNVLRVSMVFQGLTRNEAAAA